MADRSVANKRYKMYKNLKEYNEQLSKENKKRKEGMLTKGDN